MSLTAIILAAGEGTRMKSVHPKVSHKLLDKPLAWWPVMAARQAGAERVIVVVGHGKDEVIDSLKDVDDLIFIEQKEQLGTGHAMRIVKEELGEFRGPTLVLYGDTPLVRAETLQGLVDENRAHHNAMTILTMHPQNPAGYGRISRNAAGELDAIIEDKDCTDEQKRKLTECNSGIYCFCGGRLTANIDKIENNNAQGEYYLTDMASIYVAAGEPVSTYSAEDERELLGINSRSHLAQATSIMRERINEQLMDEGVTMLDPTQVWIGPEVSVGRDTIIYPQTILSGATTIGEECVIGPNTRITNSTIANNASIEESVCLESTIDEGASVGPRAYLRPGTHLCKNAHVGTHVELKNSTVGEGSKVPHLSYIGDTEMGSGVNIGAGSITCNYDGVFKNKTTIGDDVFIGSDTMMVAPVSIGDGALVGASSCITRDVPAGAIALERSEQQHIEGAAVKRMKKLRELKQKEQK